MGGRTCTVCGRSLRANYSRCHQCRKESLYPPGTAAQHAPHWRPQPPKSDGIVMIAVIGAAIIGALVLVSMLAIGAQGSKVRTTPTAAVAEPAASVVTLVSTETVPVTVAPTVKAKAKASAAKSSPPKAERSAPAPPFVGCSGCTCRDGACGCCGRGCCSGHGGIAR